MQSKFRPIRASVNVFLDNAQRILDTAVNGTANGIGLETLTILVMWDGSLRAVSGSEWPLAALQDEYGSRMCYRVATNGGRVKVEGRMGTEKCLLEAEPPSAIARRLLGSVRS